MRVKNVKTDDTSKVPVGVFAAGDVRDHTYR